VTCQIDMLEVILFGHVAGMTQRNARERARQRHRRRRPEQLVATVNAASPHVVN
jgi:hypothetical protein